MLAALGLGTLIAWQVRLRTREIGIRLALGATSRQVIGTVMSESIPLVIAGVGAGLAAALLLGRFVESLLFEVTPRDPVSVAAAGGAAAAIALLSAYVTARSAARVDPLVAQRNEWPSRLGTRYRVPSDQIRNLLQVKRALGPANPVFEAGAELAQHQACLPASSASCCACSG